MKRTTCFRKKAPKWDFHFAATYKVMSAPKASEVAAEDVNDGGAAKDVPNRFVETENTRVDDRIDVPTQCHCHFAICMLLTDADGGQRKQMLLPELAVFMSEGCRRANERTAGKTRAVNTPEHACGSYLMVIKVYPARRDAGSYRLRNAPLRADSCRSDAGRGVLASAAVLPGSASAWNSGGE